jgi:mono/diheme cytochrome c family protein
MLKGLPRLCSAITLGTAVAIAALAFGSVAVSTVAQATPQYAAATGKPCGQCHVNKAGGGQLNAFGEKFKENGHKLPK